jgi:transposase
METIYFLGIDISKKKFDAALTINGKTFDQSTCENNSKSIESFFQDLKKKYGLCYTQLTVCMEHTGVYCQPLLGFLVKKSIKVCLESAIQIQRSQGLVRGKNDKVDAQRIATYAYKNRENLMLWKPQRLVIQKLKALLVTRDRLVKVKTMLSVPIKECEEYIEESVYRAIAKSCQKSLKSITEEIKMIEKSIMDLARADQSVKKQYRSAISVTGIGQITALNMIISTGEFERIREPKRFACYSGVAPFEHSSGTSVRGKTRTSKMANMTIKTLLTMGAMSAVQHDSELRTYHERKIAEGKNYWSVINAVRNKLITRVYACVNNEKLYQKNNNHTLV